MQCDYSKLCSTGPYLARFDSRANMMTITGTAETRLEEVAQQYEWVLLDKTGFKLFAYSSQQNLYKNDQFDDVILKA